MEMREHRREFSAHMTEPGRNRLLATADRTGSVERESFANDYLNRNGVQKSVPMYRHKHAYASCLQGWLYVCYVSLSSRIRSASADIKRLRDFLLTSPRERHRNRIPTTATATRRQVVGRTRSRQVYGSGNGKGNVRRRQRMQQQ